MTVLVKSSLLLCFVGVFFLLLVRCDCLRFHQAKENEEVPSSVVKLLSRKLRVPTGKLTVTVTEHVEKASHTPEKKNLPDKLEWEKASAAVAKADLGQQRTDKGEDSTEFFTMDYSKVRRRRPIHNKGLPVGP